MRRCRLLRRASSVTARQALVQPPPLTNASAAAFQLISWNVNGLRAPGRIDGLRRLAAEHRPDLIVLQESKLQTQHCEPMRETLASELPDYDAWFYSSIARKGYAGSVALVRSGDGGRGADDDAVVAVSHAEAAHSATLCPERTTPAAPLRRVTFGCGEDESDVEGRCLTLEYESFVVVALYVPNSGAKLARLSYRITVWDTRLATHVAEVERTTGKPVVVTGDLNVAHREVDIHNHWASHVAKQAGCTAAERESFGKWLDSSDRVDVHRAMHGDAAAQYTYWSTRARGKATNKGLRLDYFVAPAAMLCSDNVKEESLAPPFIHAVDILHDGFGGANTKGSVSPSDHCPITLTLRV